MALRNMSAYLLVFGLFDFIYKSARNSGKVMQRPERFIQLMATVTAAMLHEEIWLVKSAFSHRLPIRSSFDFSQDFGMEQELTKC